MFDAISAATVMANSDDQSQCLFCGQPANGPAPCSFHSGRSVYAQQSGLNHYVPQQSHEDVYFWSCCGKKDVIAASRSPGCCVRPQHSRNATIAVVADATEGALLRDVATILARRGISVRVELRFPPDPPDLIVVWAHEFNQTLQAGARASVRDSGSKLVVVAAPGSQSHWELQTYAAGVRDPSAIADQLQSLLPTIGRPSQALKRPGAFLSYTRRNREVADAYYEAMGGGGWCWRDTTGLNLGVLWAEEIDTAILESRVFVAILSRQYTTSTYCMYECGLARRAGKRIILVDLDKSWESSREALGLAAINLNCIAVSELMGADVELRTSRGQILVDQASNPSLVVFDEIDELKRYPYRYQSARNVRGIASALYSV